MRGAVINPARGVLTLGTQRINVGYLDVDGVLRISFLAEKFKPPASGKARLDEQPIIIDEVKSESPFSPHRTWTLIARREGEA